MVLTRRAYREKMEVSRWLPNELLVQIIQHFSKAEQATLCRICKLFRDLCLPVLYRDVKIKNTQSVHSFCAGVIENPSRADTVRSLVLDLPYNPYTRIRRKLILTSLKLMLRLTHLSISPCVLDNRHGGRCALLEECSLPRLISCDITVPRWGVLDSPLQNSTADLVAVFLARHPTLKHVRIQVDSYDSGSCRMVTSPSIRVSLPNLECYEGDAVFMPAIDAMDLKEVRLVWPSKDEDIEKIVTRISPMTNPDVSFICSHVYWGDRSLDQIMTAVSTHMPHPRTLRLRCFGTFPFSTLNHNTIRRITECLPKFTKLVHLAIHHGRDYYAASRGNKDKDRVAVKRWGESCPTLEACFLNYYAWRKVGGRWEEYSIEEFWILAGLPDLTAYY
ncbi:hypothetical protein MSAN_01191900 [Mycena sanguinolenta]|uniref:F-box domain-containing protein n=1 Tax=Mycena sanguinolenta TaxID=230812 RepID=A0A8H6YNH3_9AGAR|nr:hypothetical protein MSAN_01191900 [Mycena sanguinolenta]